MITIEKDNLRPAAAPADAQSDADATLNGITRYTLCPPVTNGTDDLDCPRSLTKLLELFHFQSLDLVIDTEGEEIERLTAAFDLLRWDELNLAKTVIQKAIVRANLFVDADLRTQLSISRHKGEGGWNLILTLLLDCTSTIAGKNLRRAQLVGREVLSALHIDPKDRTRMLTADELTTPEEEAVRSVAHETLCHSGGHVWRKPLAIVINEKIELKLEGRMAAKPDHVNYQPTQKILVGKCRGFINDHKHRAVLFCISDGTCVEIGFMESQVQVRNIDLLYVAELNRREAVCRVTTQQTIDARGKHVYGFVSIEADDPEPDLLTAYLDVNKNKETATSATHSYES
jgi:hypothetical protein